MPVINCRELHRLYECEGPQKTVAHLAEALEKGHLKAEDFSLKDLAESLIPNGREWIREYCDPRPKFRLLEASGAVDTSAFSNITGQIVYNKLLSAYNMVPNTVSAMIPNVPTQLSGEKIAGIGQLGDAASVVDEGEAFLPVGLSEDYIETPSTKKRGFIVPVTKEAIFFDRTNLVLSRAADVGTWLRLNKEKRVIDAIIDASATGDHRYKWKGTTYASYAASGGHGFVNLKTSNALTDWTDIDNVEQLFANMTDPFTGEPIMMAGKTLLVCPELEWTARSILLATSWQVGDTTGTAPVQVGRNLVSGYTLVSSPQLKARQTALSGLGTTWYAGDFSKALAYMENWPVTVSQAAQNSTAEFERDIVAQYKASERGAVVWTDPRYVVKSTVA